MRTRIVRWAVAVAFCLLAPALRAENVFQVSAPGPQ